MPTAFLEEFETDGNGTRYTTSTAEFLGATFGGSAIEYFTRTDDTAESGTSVIGSFTNTDGFWFGAMDVDGPGVAVESETMTFTGIDISNLTDLTFSGSFAAFFGSFNAWDRDTQVFFEVSIDGGAYEKVMQFASISNRNNRPAAIDTDLDGIGDGARLDSEFTSYSAAISGTGTTLDLRVTFENLNQIGEEFHLDSLEIAGTTAVDLAVDDLSTSGEDALVNLDLLGNDGVGTSDPVTIISGGGTGVITPILVTSAGGREGSAIFFPSGALNFAFDPLGNFADLDDGETDTVTISYTVTDGTGETDTADVILTIEGDSDIILGDGDDNFINGTAGDDVISSGAGNDTINGLGGADSMIGGTGDDYYYIDNAGDVIVEAAGEGYEYVSTTISYTLDENVESATARGSSDIDLTGNEGDNWLNGNAGNNLLTGLGGNDRLQGADGDDTLDGGAGNDVLFGGTGVDRFVFEDNGGTDNIQDYEAGEIIDLSGTSAADFGSLDIQDVATGAQVDYGTGVVIVVGVAATDLDASSFDFT